MGFEDLNNLILYRISSEENNDEVINYTVIETGRIIGQGSVASILLIDNAGLLRNGYSPELPTDYLQAIDGIRPHPELGTCASAAATGEIVITSDFCADDKWAELKHLPLSIGFRGAWSIPTKNADNEVIGTFGVYTTEVRTPTKQELEGTQLLATTIASVLYKKQMQQHF